MAKTIKKSPNRVNSRKVVASNKSSNSSSSDSPNVWHKIIVIGVFALILIGIFVAFQFKTEGQAISTVEELLVSLDVPSKSDDLILETLLFDDNNEYNLAVNWIDDIFYGVSISAVKEDGAIVNVDNLRFYALMGQGESTLEDFNGDGVDNIRVEYVGSNINLYKLTQEETECNTDSHCSSGQVCSSGFCIIEQKDVGHADSPGSRVGGSTDSRDSTDPRVGGEDTSDSLGINDFCNQIGDQCGANLVCSHGTCKLDDNNNGVADIQEPATNPDMQDGDGVETGEETDSNFCLTSEDPGTLVDTNEGTIDSSCEERASSLELTIPNTLKSYECLGVYKGIPLLKKSDEDKLRYGRFNAAGTSFLMSLLKCDGLNIFNYESAKTCIDSDTDLFNLYLPNCELDDLDTDSDGLSDDSEASLGTSPLLADTDGDGINDFEESSNLLMDPTDLNVPECVDENDCDGSEVCTDYVCVEDDVDTDGDGVIDNDDFCQDVGKVNVIYTDGGSVGCIIGDSNFDGCIINSEIAGAINDFLQESVTNTQIASLINMFLTEEGCTQ
jgi:hypothetical protein